MAWQHQQYQHNKEAAFIKELKAYCDKTNIEFIDTTGTDDDIQRGIDCRIDGIPYDLKCSDSMKLTMTKTLPNGETYNPYEKHQRVKYLYCVPSKHCCYEITKREFASYIEYYKEIGQLDMLTSTYTGDGNINVCVNIIPLLLHKQPKFIIKETSL